MANDALSQTWEAIKSQTPTNTGVTGGGWSGVGVGIGIFLGVAVIAVIGAFIWFHFSEKKKWNIITRVHYENPSINGVTLGNGVPTRRIRFKDGRVVYLYKTPIQGYTVSPELLTWSRPREHDVVVTQDKKLFCIVGVDNVDTQRKMLKVDISYPDIEMDRQDLQNFIDQKKVDDPNERLKIIAKVALWVFVIIGVVVVMVVGGKAYTEGKNIDLQREQVNLQRDQASAKVMEGVNTFVTLLNKNGIKLNLTG